jgi:hypothetical protein
MKQIALQQFVALGFGQAAQQMRRQLLGICQRGIQIIFKPQSHHKRRPTGFGIHALTIQVSHGVGYVVAGCNTGF